jgi:hypothetical protein
MAPVSQDTRAMRIGKFGAKSLSLTKKFPTVFVGALVQYRPSMSSI